MFVRVFSRKIIENGLEPAENEQIPSGGTALQVNDSACAISVPVLYNYI